MNRVIVVGSPRVSGRSAALADLLFNTCIDDYPDDGVSIVSVASTNVEPCMGCDACARALDERPALPEEGDPLFPHRVVVESDAPLHRCVIDDDMPEVRKHLDTADELIVVTPVYFASVPAQLKCLLDRLQPYYRSDLRTRPKRPLTLHVVGEGGDPHGIEPLIGTVRSAFSVAGFQLDLILDWRGCIDEAGELVEDAAEYPVPPLGGWAPAEGEPSASRENEQEWVDDAPAWQEDEPSAKRDGGRQSASREKASSQAKPKEKPLLSLSDEPKKAKRSHGAGKPSGGGKSSDRRGHQGDAGKGGRKKGGGAQAYGKDSRSKRKGGRRG